MKVEYIATTSDKLSELSVVNGQLIYLSDIDASYYDMGGSRRPLSSMKLVSVLPSTSDAQENMIYGVVNASGNVDTYIWDASASTYRSLSGYVATTSSLGLVRPDGTTITIDANGYSSQEDLRREILKSIPNLKRGLDDEDIYGSEKLYFSFQ